MIVLPGMVGAQKATEEAKRGMGSGIVFPGLAGSVVLKAQ